jgi:hypothetical protein
MDADDCFAANCPTLETQSFDVANQCVIQRTVDEPTEGCKWLSMKYSVGGTSADHVCKGLDQLPGNRPVTWN